VAYTEKQERNGATGDAAVNTTVAQPSTDLTSTVSSGLAQAVAAGLANMQYGHTVSYDWDDGLAISEMPGEQ